jgi:ribonucleoside-diphosphate reductase alpha subunit
MIDTMPPPEDVNMEDNASKVKFVLKRDGSKQEINAEKVKARLLNLAEGLNQEYMDFDVIVGKVMAGVYDNVTTVALDELASETCAYMTIVHPDYSILAARIAVSNLHKRT